MRHHLVFLAALHAITACYTGAEPAEPDGTDTPTTGDPPEEGSTTTDDPLGCAPGTQVACYPGPEGTLGVGLCAAGVRTCLDDGELGRCEGARVPTPEDCATAEDDDCNGSSACGEFLETRVVAPAEGLHALATGGAYVYLAWSAGGSVWLGRFPEDGVPPVDLGAAIGSDALHLDVDPATGDVWLAATMRAGGLWAADPDDGCVPVEGDADVLLARFDRMLGPIDRRCLGNEHHQSITSLDVDADGAVLIAGRYAGALELPVGAELPAAQGHDLAFVASIDATLNATRWAHGLDLGVIAVDDGPTVIGAPDRSVVAVGTVTGGFDAAGGGDLFVNRYTADGSERWARRFGNGADQRALGASVGDGGHLWIAAETAGQVALDSAPVGDDVPYMLLFAHLDLEDGGVLAHRHVGGPNLVASAGNRALTVDPAGDVTFAGFAFDGYTLGPLAAPAAGGSDALLIKLGVDATPLWSHRLGDESNQIGVLVVPTAHGLLFAGEFVGSMAIGDGWLNADARTMFVLRYGD